ncbi:GGDEF domain-containing protein [Piscinibacter sp.]|uniref:GGDEF domain-containing protein n=1 Tax=Piscinibacter sp. TaxID=1903157 RepID=UPI002BAEBE03|nr:GGDEF domain-containing protein [Albitalea sp.]HUG21063.1 GGDEF domain-containing protein [Albitalea sp.]
MRLAYALALALVLPGVAAAAGVPAALLEIERAICDDPRQVAAHAEATLKSAAPASDAAFQAQLRQIAAASGLEEDERVAELLPAVVQAAKARRDDTAECLLETLRIYNDHSFGTLAQVEKNAAAAIERTQRAGQPWCEARLRQSRGDVYLNEGRIAQGTADFQAALAYYESAGETLRRAMGLADLSWAYKRDTENPGSMALAIESSHTALDLVDQQQQRSLASLVHHNLAGTYLAAKRLPEARRHAVLSRRFAEQTRDTLGVAYTDRLLGRIELDEGRPAAALERFSSAIEVFSSSGIHELELVAALGRSEALLALRAPDAARRQLEDAATLRERVSHPDTDVDYYRVALDVAAARKDTAAVVAAALAHAAAVRAREQDQNRRVAAETRERFLSERTEAENRLLRERQIAAEARQKWLTATLALSAVIMGLLVSYLVQQRRLRRRLKIMAEVDELTQLPNRRCILELAQAFGKGRRSGDLPLGLAVLDVDHFKRVNDEFGHEVGDVALITLAQCCRQVLRKHDVVGRLGGEEFLMVFPSTRQADVGALFERLRKVLRDTPVPGMRADQRLSCSMGSAELQPGASVKETLRRADEALYRAKSSGRDRLVLAETPGPPTK